jgi:hypothetical protein
MEYLIRLIEAIIWPTVVIWLGYLFKSELQKLLARMSTFKYKELEAKFERELEDAEESARSVEPPPDRNKTAAHRSKDRLTQIAEASPRAAIIEAWTMIETAAVKAGLSLGAALPRTSPGLIIQRLVESGEFSPTSLELIEKLRKLRNHAAHLPDFAISPSEAERYLELAAQCELVLEETSLTRLSN